MTEAADRRDCFQSGGTADAVERRRAVIVKVRRNNIVCCARGTDPDRMDGAWSARSGGRQDTTPILILHKLAEDGPFSLGISTVTGATKEVGSVTLNASDGLLPFGWIEGGMGAAPGVYGIIV